MAGRSTGTLVQKRFFGSSEFRNVSKCDIPYKKQLESSELLPLSFWHEYLGVTLLFKIINGLMVVSCDIVPVRIILEIADQLELHATPK